MPTPEETAAAAAAAAKPWTETLGLTGDALGYAQNRGLDKKPLNEAVLATIEAHRNAETKLGYPSDLLVRLPKDINDTATRDALYTKLGRPADVKGYDFKDAGLDEAFGTFLAGKAFELGLSKTATEALAKSLQEFNAKGDEADTAAKAAKFEVERQAMLQSWGGNAQVNLIIAQKAYEAMGFTKEMVATMEAQIGTAAIMNQFLKIGQKIGEDIFVGNNNGNPNRPIVTREAAAERLKLLKADPAYSKLYLAGDAAKVQEMNDLHRLAFGQAA